MSTPTSKPIAAYCFLMGCYYYWSAARQGFYLLEVAPGNLVAVDQTPIPLSRMQEAQP